MNLQMDKYQDFKATFNVGNNLQMTTKTVCYKTEVPLHRSGLTLRKTIFDHIYPILKALKEQSRYSN